MGTNPTLLGTVQDVQGATVSVTLDEDTVSGLVFIDGHGYRIGQIGSFVRFPIGFTDLYGIVSHVGVGAVPETMSIEHPHGRRWIRVQLVGEAQRSGDFQRGILQYPTIGDEVHIVTDEDLALIYGRPDELRFVRVGSLSSTESIPALVNIDLLVSRHSAVVGATGAGKSTTVASLIASLSAPTQYPSARIIVFDIHGEYHAALADRASIFRVNADTGRSLYVPYWALRFDELLEVTPFHDVGDTDRAALADRIRELKLASIRRNPREGVTIDSLTVDTPVPFSIHRLWYELHRYVLSTHTVGQGSNQSSATEAIVTQPDGQPALGSIMDVVPPRYRPITQSGSDRVFLSGAPLNIKRQLIATQALLKDSRYDFIFRPGRWCPSPHLDDLDARPEVALDELIKDWVGSDSPVTILDLSGVPVSILTDLIGVLVRLLVDSLFWARELPEGGRSRPLLLVFEEAHAYLNSGSAGSASSAVRRVIREGRKYGLGAMIVSQRPAEVDPTILSQCGTLFSMRLSNSTDRSHVSGTSSDSLEGFFNMLPTLRTGEVIIVGEAVHLPLRALVDLPGEGRRPDSNDPRLYDPRAQSGWNRPRQPEDYARVLRNWRSEGSPACRQEKTE